MMDRLWYIKSLVTTIVAFSAFVGFLVFPNYPAATWAFMTAACNAVLTHIYNLQRKGQLSEWYTCNELNHLTFLGFFFFAIGSTGLTFHVAMEFLGKIPLLPVEQSEVIPAVWCFLTLASGLMLFFCARKCKRRLQRRTNSLLSGEEVDD